MKYLLKNGKKLFSESKCKGKRKLDYNFCLRWLSTKELMIDGIKRKVIGGGLKNRIENKLGQLNKYLHPSFRHMEIYKGDCTSCPATVKYDEKEYRKTVMLFQDIVALIIRILRDYIIYFLPDKKDKLYEELKELFSLKDLEKDLNRKLIFSKELERIIGETKKMCK